MKKFLIFLFFSAFLIISEYFLFNELVSQKRVVIVAIAFAVASISTYAVIRIFKRNLLSGKAVSQ